MPPVRSLWAVVAKVLDRFMQAPIAVRRAPVAIIPIIRLRAGCASKEQKPAECGCRQQNLAEHGLQQMLMQFDNTLRRTPPRLGQGPRPVHQTHRRGKCRGRKKRWKLSANKLCSNERGAANFRRAGKNTSMN